MAKKNHRSANAVADYFLVEIHIEEELVGILKMQKLCYLAQGWSLALLGRPLFDDVIEAWALGPMIPLLFRRFKRHRWHAIPFKLRTEPSKELDAEEMELLDWVWKEYGRRSARELKRLTRSQTPWKEVYGDTPLPEPCYKEITQKKIKAYFLTQKIPAGWSAKKSKAA